MGYSTNFDEQEGVIDPEEDAEDNPLSRINIDITMPRVAVLTRGKAATGGEISGPLVHHRKKRARKPQEEKVHEEPK